MTGVAPYSDLLTWTFGNAAVPEHRTVRNSCPVLMRAARAQFSSHCLLACLEILSQSQRPGVVGDSSKETEEKMLEFSNW